MAIIVQPADIHTAFNPVIFRTDYNILGVNRGFRIAYQEFDVTLNKELFLNGQNLFDVQKVIQEFFIDSKEISTFSTKIIYDKNLFAKYNAISNGHYRNKVVINAVAQIGESSDFTIKRGKFLTDFERLKLYDGYPITVSVLNFTTGAFVGSSNGVYNSQLITSGVYRDVSQEHLTLIVEPSSYMFINNGLAFEPLTTNDLQIITTNTGEAITISQPRSGYIENRIPVDNVCTPVNPFYIRWINMQGGWDYFMFQHRQTISGQMKTGETFNPAVLNQETAKTFSEVLNIEASEEITVGATGLTESEFKAVSKLIYSPRIEYYDKEKDMWFRLISDKNGFEKDTYNVTQSVEFTFALPQVQTQF